MEEISKEHLSYDDMLEKFHTTLHWNIITDDFISDYHLEEKPKDVEGLLNQVASDTDRIFSVSGNILLSRNVNFAEEIITEPDYPVMENLLADVKVWQQKKKTEEQVSGIQSPFTWEHILPLLDMEGDKLLKIVLYNDTYEKVDFRPLRQLLSGMNTNATERDFVRYVVAASLDRLYMKGGIALETLDPKFQAIIRRDNQTRNNLKFQPLPSGARVYLEDESDGTVQFILEIPGKVGERFVNPEGYKAVAFWQMPAKPRESTK